MEQKLLNNNDRIFRVNGQEGKTFKVVRIASMDDLSLLTNGQSLALKINVDDVAESQLLSHFQFADSEGKVAIIEKTFDNFKFLQLEIFADNPLLSADLNFNLVMDYELK
jgi:hypothetical protein